MRRNIEIRGGGRAQHVRFLPSAVGRFLQTHWYLMAHGVVWIKKLRARCKEGAEKERKKRREEEEG